MENAITEKKKPSVKKILNTVLNVVLWIFLLFSALVTVISLTSTKNYEDTQKDVPDVFDYSLMYVLTDSMDGENMKEGDLILVKLFDDEDLQHLKVEDLKEGEDGTIISFLDLSMPLTEKNTRPINTHRVYQINDTDGDGYIDSIITKGDNEPLADSLPRQPRDLVGTYVCSLGALGDAYEFFRDPNGGFLFCIVVPLLLFFVYEVFIVVKNILELKNKGKKILSADDEELIKQQAIAEYLRQQEEAKAKSEQSEQPTPDADVDSQDERKA